MLSVFTGHLLDLELNKKNTWTQTDLTQTMMNVLRFIFFPIWEAIHFVFATGKMVFRKLWKVAKPSRLFKSTSLVIVRTRRGTKSARTSLTWKILVLGLVVLVLWCSGVLTVYFKLLFEREPCLEQEKEISGLGHLSDTEVFKVTSVLKRVLESLEANNLTEVSLSNDINDALKLLDIKEMEDTIVIPNSHYKTKVYKKYPVSPEIEELMVDSKNWTAQSNLSHLLTMVLNFHSYNQAQTQDLFNEIVPRLGSLPIIVATRHEKDLVHDSNKLITVVHTVFHQTEGSVWNQLLDRVKTPFVLVGRNLATIAGQEKFFRLIKVLPSLGSAIVGGATRTREGGRWASNCFQMLYQNYSIYYQNGYQKSDQNCLYCDFIWGPFVANKQILSENPLSETLPSHLLFHDFFFRINSKGKYTAAVCPDSMFEVLQSSRNFPNKADWTPFAKYHGINKIRYPDGTIINYTCEELGQNFPVEKEGKLNSPCALQYFTDLLKLIFKTCEANKIFCQLGPGNLLGAVKFNSLLPWQYNMDVFFSESNRTAVEVTVLPALARQGLILKPMLETQAKNCIDSKTIACYVLSIPNTESILELYSSSTLLFTDIRFRQSRKLAPTQILLNGEWIRAPYNPGHLLYSEFGENLYKHIGHVPTRYDASSTLKYKYANSGREWCHDSDNCLDKISPDGNIQFKDPVA